MTTSAKDVIKLSREQGILRTRDLGKTGIPRIVLTRMCKSGLLKRLNRGLYTLPDADLTENHSLAEAARRIPHGVICLLSALRFHGLTTQSPPQTWMAINAKARKPRVPAMPLKFVRFSGQAWSYGVEAHRIENVQVNMTSPAKTVADCFKYRNKIGLDVAMEALRDYRRARRSRDELWRAATACRVTAVMRPYMEALA